MKRKKNFKNIKYIVENNLYKNNFFFHCKIHMDMVDKNINLLNNRSVYNLLMTKLVSYSMSQGDAVVLVDTATTIRLTHTSNMSHS